MWEEDPAYQDSHFRFLVRFLKVTGVLAMAASLYCRDWEPLRNYATIVGIGVLSIGIYGLIAFLVVKLLLVASGWIKRQSKPGSARRS